MERVPREAFVPAGLRDRAYEDEALPLPAGQTVSQPYVVAFICQGLALRGPERVLDVGTGSGYQAAVLAELAAEVHSIERIPELAEGARAALAAAGYERVTVHVGDGTLGVPAHAPYDGIAVAAASADVPAALRSSARAGGWSFRLVAVPFRSSRCSSALRRACVSSRRCPCVSCRCSPASRW